MRFGCVMSRFFPMLPHPPKTIPQPCGGLDLRDESPLLSIACGDCCVARGKGPQHLSSRSIPPSARVQASSYHNTCVYASFQTSFCLLSRFQTARGSSLEYGIGKALARSKLLLRLSRSARIPRKVVVGNGPACVLDQQVRVRALGFGNAVEGFPVVAI